MATSSLQGTLFDWGLEESPPDPSCVSRVTEVQVVDAAADELPSAILKILGPVGQTISDCFHRMALAENAIARVSAQHPHEAKLLHGAFSILNWRLPVPARDAIYVAHAEELLQRVVERKSTAPATKAEALMFLSSASLRAPLRQQPAALYAALFREVLSAEAHFLDGRDPVEPWAGASEELLATLRRDLRFADRNYPSGKS